MNSDRQPGTSRPKRGLTTLWITVITVGLAAVLAAGCNGGGDGGNSATVEPTPGTTAQPTGQPSTTEACQALTSLNSYRFVSNVTLESPEETVEPSDGGPTPVANITPDFEGDLDVEINIDGSVVAPDRFEAVMITADYNPVHFIAVGDERWISQEGEAWIKASPQHEIPYKPMDICNSVFPELDLGQAQGEEETVNNVPARHYTFRGTSSGQAFASIFGAGSDTVILLTAMDVEVWVAEEDGWPVRMDIKGRGLYADRRELRVHIGVELRDVNSEDIRIELPF